NWESSFQTPEEQTEDRYRLITPWKFSLGVSKFFSRGLLSADVEYVDYSSTKLRTIGNVDPSLETGWDADMKDAYQGVRSEEHTSELQSRENLVCRLLLEKKKKD